MVMQQNRPLNVSNTRYMIFYPRNENAYDVNIMIFNEPIEWVYVTKFLVVQTDA